MNSQPSAMNRRQILATFAGSAAAPFLPGCSTLTGGGGFIDAHVHVWTPDTVKYPLAAGFTEKSLVPASFTPEELLLQARPNGVERILLIQMSFYKYDNRYMLDSMERYPGMFGGVAIVDHEAADVCGTMKHLAARGVRGFRVYSSRAQAQEWSKSKGMRDMWTCAADNGLAICLLADPDALPVIQKMCAAFPRTRVVIDHFARIGMKGAVNTKDLDNLCTLAAFPNTYVKTSAFYALGKKKAPYTDLGPMIQRLRGTFGTKRLMWATDCPYQVQNGHTYADSIALIRDRLPFLSTQDKAWMLRGTADKVFFT